MATWQFLSNSVRGDLQGQTVADAASEGNSAYKDAHFLRWAQDFVDLYGNRVPIEELTVNEISVVSGTKEYALPSDFSKADTVIAVDPVDSSETELRRYHPDADIDLRGDTVNGSDIPSGYYLTGYGDSRKIGFLPEPTTALTVKLRYQRKPARPTALTDSCDFPNEWFPAVKAHFKMECAALDQLPQKVVYHLQERDRAVRRAKTYYAEQETGPTFWR